MGLSSDQRRRLDKMLDKMDESEIDKLLASVKNFTNWLKNNLYDIYKAVKDTLESLWSSICNAFS